MIVSTGLLTSFGEPFNCHKRLRKQGIKLIAGDVNSAQVTQKSRIVSELCEILCAFAVKKKFNRKLRK